MNEHWDGDVLLCNCCDKPKAKLLPKKSTLLKGMPLFMCETCIEEKKEPRYIVILAGRKYGIAKVKEYIIKGRYCGKPIEASELVT